VAAFAVGLWAVEASGQGGQSTSGMFGSRTLGGGIGGGTGNMFGSPGNRVEQAQSGAGELGGNERFVRDNRQPGAFVGADTADTSNFFSVLAGSGLGGQGGLLSGGLGGNRSQGGLLSGGLGTNRANRFSQTSSRLGGRGRSTFTAALSIGFEYPKPAAAEVSTRLQERLARIAQIRRLTPLVVTFHGRTAVLRGAVATEHDREMVARLARMEPGVREVQNELTVGAPPTGPPAAPKPEEPDTGSSPKSEPAVPRGSAAEPSL